MLVFIDDAIDDRATLAEIAAALAALTGESHPLADLNGGEAHV
ncbi:hypothetical protein JOF56_009520 [Kibdelosporangium banguiense]|uniref:Uncharacterized protein n=1 Tax=Kibdelosporangium banguiense TaxID=1365924 RepID=A0ABS4TYY6_9PSEU|nr:hypothetical protein [Kibdelosporangium banguiense]MBP2329135.1 hypothetical protein [Kibdelosporangium banguiense]